MVADLTESCGTDNFSLDSLMFGGAPAPDSLAARARLAFPSASMYVLPLSHLNNAHDSIAGAKATG